MVTACTICDRRPARYEARFDTANGRAVQDLCRGCLAGRLAAHPPHSRNVARDYRPWEITDMKRSEPGIPEDEMEELIEEHDWVPYYMQCHPCRKEKHDKCKPVRQPTNHIDPHPTVCICECREDPELDAIRHRIAGTTPDEDDEFIFGGDDDDDFEFEDDELVFDDEDEEDDDELIFDDEDDEYVFD